MPETTEHKAMWPVWDCPDPYRSRIIADDQPICYGCSEKMNRIGYSNRGGGDE